MRDQPRRIGARQVPVASAMITTRFVLRGLAATLLVAVSGSVWSATWQWRDGQGRMVYSDRPPPGDVRPAQIVRSPGPAAPRGAADQALSIDEAAIGDPSAVDAASPAPDAPAPAGLEGAAVPGAPPPAPSWVERERAFRQRQAEQQANEAKAREERENAERAQQMCEDLRHTIRTLESGLVVVSMNARGEREALSDAERAGRLERARAERDRSCASH